MDHVSKTYVEFFYPGMIFTESSTQQVQERDHTKVEVPNHAFAFRFFDIIEAIIEIDGKPVKLMSGRINESPLYYYGGRIYTRAEVAKGLPDNLTLLENMHDNDWDRVIKTRKNNFQPFHSTDILIEATS